MPPSPPPIVVIALAVEGALLGLAVVIGWAVGEDPLARLAPSWRAALWGASATIPLLLGLAWTLRVQAGALHRLRLEVERNVGPLFARCGPLDLLVIAAAAGLAEEALFRGAIQPALAGRLGAPAAILLTGALFGAAHPVTPLYAALAALIGVYLGWLTDAHGLLAAVVTHGTYDFVALLALQRAVARAEPALAREDGP